MQDGGRGNSGARLLADNLAAWRGIVGRPVATPQDLIANMRALYAAVFDTDFAALDPANVKALAMPASEALFDLYLTLRDRLPEWHAQGLMTEGAPRAVRDAMRVLRYTIDIVGEVANDYQRIDENATPFPMFGGPAGWTLMHPGLGEGTSVDFRAGDVLLVRGRLSNSAAIARIGDVDAQFSHVGIVHGEPASGQWLVEALIEDGSVITPLEEVLNHGLGRAMLFRHRDPVLARNAASYAADRVRGAQGTPWGWTPYDFSMEMEGEDRFFCSKLVRYGYVGASDGALAHLPTFPTRLSMKNRDFFDRLGVTAVDTFAPADFEVEPVFDVVAEWRDYRVTSALRMQDLVMSKLFDWMEDHGYRFKEGLGISIMALLGRMTSIAPDAVKQALSVALGLPRIPSNMKVRTITTIGMLHKTAQPILQRLIALEENRIKTSGRPLHPREVQEELERIRLNSGGRIGYLVADG